MTNTFIEGLKQFSPDLHVGIIKGTVDQIFNPSYERPTDQYGALVYDGGQYLIKSDDQRKELEHGYDALREYYAEKGTEDETYLTVWTVKLDTLRGELEGVVYPTDPKPEEKKEEEGEEVGGE